MPRRAVNVLVHADSKCKCIHFTWTKSILKIDVSIKKRLKETGMMGAHLWRSVCDDIHYKWVLKIKTNSSPSVDTQSILKEFSVIVEPLFLKLTSSSKFETKNSILNTILHAVHKVLKCIFIHDTTFMHTINDIWAKGRMLKCRLASLGLILFLRLF